MAGTADLAEKATVRNQGKAETVGADTQVKVVMAEVDNLVLTEKAEADIQVDSVGERVGYSQEWLEMVEVDLVVTVDLDMALHKVSAVVGELVVAVSVFEAVVELVDLDKVSEVVRELVVEVSVFEAVVVKVSGVVGVLVVEVLVSKVGKVERVCSDIQASVLRDLHLMTKVCIAVQGNLANTDCLGH